MAKRRNKNKSKRKFAGLKKPIRICRENVEKMIEKDLINPDIDVDNVDKLLASEQISDPCGVTNEDSKCNSDSVENSQNILAKENKIRARKSISSKEKRLAKPVADKNLSDEINIYPNEANGEMCINVTCGENEAILYLSKLCMGSKGACINFSNSWLTPNEFQTISGRESAKDWKRSIKHKDHTLKLIIAKGLLTVQNKSTKAVKENLFQHCLKKASEDFQSSPDINVPRERLKDNVVGIDATGVVTSRQRIPETENQNRKRCRAIKKSRQRKTGLKEKPTMKQPLSELSDACVAEEINEKEVDDAKPECVTGDISENQSHIQEEVSVPDDSYRDEEMRLDEFVKTLKLTKSTGSLEAPLLHSVDIKKDVHGDPGIGEPAMPVLQKESNNEETGVTTAATVNTDNNVNASDKIEHFPSAVTPPPTPPIGRTANDEKHLYETSESHLNEHIRDRVSETDTMKEALCKSELIRKTDEGLHSTSKIQSLLLQDALQSAKRYKEKLKHNVATTAVSDKSIGPTHVVESSKSNVVKDRFAHQTTFSSTDIPRAHYSMPSSSMSTSVVSIQPKASSVPSSSSFSSKVSSASGTSSYLPSLPSIPNVINGHEKNKRYSWKPNSNAKTAYDKGTIYSPYKAIHTPFHKADAPGLQATEFSQSLAGMSFWDLLSVLSSIYGKLPFPVDSKEAAFLALQEFHRRHNIDMLRVVTQGQMHGSPSSIVYPMMTQQIILAMTQQFYSMREFPGCLPQTKSTGNKSETNKMYSAKQPSSKQHSKKRKHEDIDHVLDLSVKRPKHDSNADQEHLTYSNMAGNDAPLDFSMKRSEQSQLNRDIFKQVVRDETYSVHGLTYPAKTYNCSPSQTSAHAKTSSIGCSCVEPDISMWSVEQVGSFLTMLEGCASYAKIFREQGISGKLLPYLTTQHLTRTLGMKVGPALTLLQTIRDIQEKPLSRQMCQIHRGNGYRTYV